MTPPDDKAEGAGEPSEWLSKAETWFDDDDEEQEHRPVTRADSVHSLAHTLKALLDAARALGRSEERESGAHRYQAIVEGAALSSSYAAGYAKGVDDALEALDDACGAHFVGKAPPEYVFYFISSVRAGLRALTASPPAAALTTATREDDHE